MCCEERNQNKDDWFGRRVAEHTVHYIVYRESVEPDVIIGFPYFHLGFGLDRREGIVVLYIVNLSSEVEV